MPVLATTGPPVEVGPLAVDVDGTGDAWLDVGLDPADGEGEPDEQALSEQAALASRASHFAFRDHVLLATLPIESHSVAWQEVFNPNRPAPLDLAGVVGGELGGYP